MENFQTNNDDYMNVLLKDKEEGHFPYRYLCDEKGKILPIVLVSAFFRDDTERARYDEYEKNGIKIAGITAYKSFPRPITDGTGDMGTKDDSFDYYGRIQNWFCCFREPTHYGFTQSHRLMDLSESDFYDAEPADNTATPKKYDFIYICLKDDDKCSPDGWNAVNRNFDLALKCFPIMMKEMKMKGLVVGRLGCGLEKQYGEQIEVIDFLPYHEFQEKIRESRFLFVPNIYDASPRVVAEAIIKDVPVLMNQRILCGSKYIHYETGELFMDDHDIRLALDRLLGKIENISPKKWWAANYSRSKTGANMRDFLWKIWPEHVGDTKEIYFM
jgi:glycosyltransferase involved in cell wall biosynthesis